MVKKHCAAQLRQPIENSLVLCHWNTLRLDTWIFKFELDKHSTKYLLGLIDSVYKLVTLCVGHVVLVYNHRVFMSHLISIVQGIIKLKL